MKGIVAFDSVHGSTKAVAEAIAEEIRSEGHQAELVFVREAPKAPLTGDLMFIGSPTRAGKMTKETKAFIDSLDAAQWKGKPIVAFDTMGPISKDASKRRQRLESIPEWERSAATSIKEALEQKGLRATKGMHFAVVGMWGPIAPEGPELAKELTRKFLATL